MTVPEDADAVLTAVKLGWGLAEVRGRNRPDAPPGAKAGLPGPPSHALPLHVERTPAEQRIEAQALLCVLARRLGVDRAVAQPSFSRAIDDQARRLAEAREKAAGGAAAPAGQPAPAGAPEPATDPAAAPTSNGGAAASGAAPAPDPFPRAVPAPGAIPAPAVAPEADPAFVTSGPGAAGRRGDGADGDGADGSGGADEDRPAVRAAGPAIRDPDTEWDALQELIFKFDQHVQDTLASGADTVAAGYQFGRALAEPYWALDTTLPGNTPSPAAWGFLLGPKRCGEMSRLAGRLSAYFHPYTAAAISGSVQVWKHVAADPGWRANARDPLYQQIRRWYELVVMHQDPTTLVQPYALIRNFRLLRRALRIFWPELSGAVIAAAALSFFAVLLGQHNISSLLKGALGFIAITGFSISGLTAKLKNQAQAMVKRLRQDVYTDLVAVAITTAPKVPSVPGTPAKQSGKMVQMVRERTITPETSN